MSDPRSPLDAALDLLVYAPVGLALTIGEELPKLAEKGRTNVTTRVTTARLVGQFAVTQGRKELERRLRQPGPAPAAPAAATPAPAPAAAEQAPPAAAPAPQPASPSRSSGSSAARPAAGATSAAELAIPSYDALSASQVVARLGGLSHGELDAVKEYEAATRGRRTILARISQLQA